MYRLSYGNGQCSGVFSTEAEALWAAKRQIEFDDRGGESSGNIEIHRRDQYGDWWPVWKTTKLRSWLEQQQRVP